VKHGAVWPRLSSTVYQLFVGSWAFGAYLRIPAVYHDIRRRAPLVLSPFTKSYLQFFSVTAVFRTLSICACSNWETLCQPVMSNLRAVYIAVTELNWLVQLSSFHSVQSWRSDVIGFISIKANERWKLVWLIIVVSFQVITTTVAIQTTAYRRPGVSPTLIH